MNQGYRSLTAPVPLAILIAFSAVLLALPGCDKKPGDEEAQSPAGDGRVGFGLTESGAAREVAYERSVPNQVNLQLLLRVA